MIARYLTDSTARDTRVAAIEALVKQAGGREAEVASTVTPLLDAPDLFVRVAAASALGKLGQRGSVQALERRRRIEPESRVINKIDAALSTLSR